MQLLTVKYYDNDELVLIILKLRDLLLFTLDFAYYKNTIVVVMVLAFDKPSNFDGQQFFYYIII